MTAVIIILAVLAVVLLLLFLPLCAQIEFNGTFSVKIKYAGISVYNSLKAAKGKEETAKKPDGEKNSPKSFEMFESLKQKHGTLGAVKELFSLLRAVTEKLKYKLKHIKFKNIFLLIRICSTNAADTAIEYGSVCAAVYPVLSLLDTFSNVKYKKIDIAADFDSDKPRISFSATVKSRIFFLLMIALCAFGEYDKFKKRNGL